MPRSKTPIVSLEEAKVRFEEWRNNRRGKARIPAELWSAAVEVARKEGINRTARELHVAWDDLKRRMPATGAVSQQPAFVELVTPHGRHALWIFERVQESIDAVRHFAERIDDPPSKVRVISTVIELEAAVAEQSYA